MAQSTQSVRVFPTTCKFYTHGLEQQVTSNIGFVLTSVLPIYLRPPQRHFVALTFNTAEA